MLDRSSVLVYAISVCISIDMILVFWSLWQVSIRSEKAYMCIRFSDVRLIVCDLIAAFRHACCHASKQIVATWLLPSDTQVATHPRRLWRPDCCLRARREPRFQTSHQHVSGRSQQHVHYSPRCKLTYNVDGQLLHIYIYVKKSRTSHSTLTQAYSCKPFADTQLHLRSKY